MNRFRIDIYDEIKANDVRFYQEEGMDKETLAQHAWSLMDKFQGNVIATVYDTKHKKTVQACYFPIEVLESFRNRASKRVLL